MSITKGALAELIINNESGGDPSDDTKYNPRMVQKTIGIVYGALIKVNITEGDGINGDFVKAFENIEIKYNSDRDEHYSDLPAKLVSLPRDQGLREVTPMQDRTGAFKISPNSSQAIYGKLFAGGFAGETGLYIEGDKIFYINLKQGQKTVLVKMIADIDSLDEDEQIPVPASKETVLYDMVVAKLQGLKATPEDKYNDSNSKQV